MRRLLVLDRLLREKLLNLVAGAEAPQGRLNDAVEEERGIDEHGETHNLQRLERLPAEAERDDPDEERPAGVNGRPRGRTDGPRHGEAEEVEATGTSGQRDLGTVGRCAYPMLIMMRTLVTQMRFCIICRRPSCMSK